MTDDDAETIEAALGNLSDIKDQQDDSPDETNEPAQDGDCWVCGSDNITREIDSGTGSNRTANRNVGGQNMRVKKVCRDCGHSWS